MVSWLDDCRYSKVLEGHLGESHPRMVPQCPHLAFTLPVPLNVSAPTNLYQSQKLLAISEDVVPIVNLDNIIKGIQTSTCNNVET